MHWTCSLWVIVFLGQTLPGLARKSRSGLRRDRLSGCTGARPLPPAHPNTEINRGRKALLTFWSRRTFGHGCQKNIEKSHASSLCSRMRLKDTQLQKQRNLPCTDLNSSTTASNTSLHSEKHHYLDPFASFDTKATETHNQISDTRGKTFPLLHNPRLARWDLL